MSGLWRSPSRATTPSSSSGCERREPWSSRRPIVLTELARGGTTLSSLGGQTKNPYDLTVTSWRPGPILGFTYGDVATSPSSSTCSRDGRLAVSNSLRTDYALDRPSRSSHGAGDLITADAGDALHRAWPSRAVGRHRGDASQRPKQSGLFKTERRRGPWRHIDAPPRSVPGSTRGYCNRSYIPSVTMSRLRWPNSRFPRRPGTVHLPTHSGGVHPARPPSSSERREPWSSRRP